MSGKKFDENKPRFDLLPPDALGDVVSVLTHGAGKYGDRNWETGLRWGRLYAAAQRHLNAWAMREDLDLDSGLPHLAHAAVNILMALALQKRGLDYLDDRPKAFHRIGEQYPERHFQEGNNEPKS